MRGLWIVLLLGVLVIITGGHDAYAQERNIWKSCQVDADCVVVGGGCCLTAVNKDHIKDGEAYCAEMNATVECLRYMDPKTSKAVCRKTPVPCFDGSLDGCMSKKAKCDLVESANDFAE